MLGIFLSCRSLIGMRRFNRPWGGRFCPFQFRRFMFIAFLILNSIFLESGVKEDFWKVTIRSLQGIQRS